MTADGQGAGAPGRGALNLEWARRWADALVRGGVEEVQLCPGSRSTPLVLACHERDELRIRVHIDERSAAFFALGYGRRSGRPCAVLTTSGTAVANLLPATVEGAASDVPLILLTADRPHYLRGTDANQTVRQPGMFAGHTRATLDVPLPSQEGLEGGVPERLAGEVFSAAFGPPPGPVHVNLPFQKPLHPTPGAYRGRRPPSPGSGEPHGAAAPDRPPVSGLAQVSGPPPVPGPSPGADEAAARLSSLVGGAARPLLIAGPSSDPDADGSAVLEFARRLGVPVLADPLSGARFAGPGDDVVVSTYAALLWHTETVARLAPDLIIRTGRTFTSASLERALLRWSKEGQEDAARPADEESSPATQVVVDSGSVRKDHLNLADWYVEHAPSHLLPRVEGERTADREAWLALWRTYGRLAREALNDSLTIPGHEAAFVAAAVRGAPEGATLFVSNSMPVRDLDLVGDPEWGRRRILGNRGASGIDGIVSTALGAAAAADEPLVAVLGDLALLHDTNGLLRAGDKDLNAVLVVIDNDGGGIFHMLPVRSFEPAFTPYFATPHGLDLAGAARLYEVPFHEAAVPEDLELGVTRAVEAGGVHIIRCRTDRQRNQEAHESSRALVTARLDAVKNETEDTDRP